MSPDQEDAVKAISNAKNPLRLLVQSLVQQKFVDSKCENSKINNNNHQHSQDKYRKGKAPTKLIIPNIFFDPANNNANGPTNGPTTNGFSSSGGSTERGSSHGPTSRNGKDIINNSNSNQSPPIQSNKSPVSPESNGRDGYTYSYSTTGDAPIQNQGLGHVQFNSNLAEMKPGDCSSMRSDWSRSSSPPPEPELIQTGLTDQEKLIINTKIEFAKRDAKRDGRDDNEKNEDAVECTIVDNKIIEKRIIRKASIASAKSIDGESEEDEDDMELEASWAKMDGQVIKAVVEQNEYGLGLSLAGHKDRETMRTYICGIHPRGKAHQLGVFKPGDQLLKVGEYYVGDRCHLNVTSMIKSCSAQSSLEVIVLRPSGVSNVAVKEVTQFPLLLDDMIFESAEFNVFVAKRELRVHKGKQGLGIMIIEGNHKATGNGIFVSDIQEQSAAFHAGLKVGDMILAINTETFLQISYDQAVSVIKSLGGNVKLLVTNPKEEEERRASGATGKLGTDKPAGAASAPGKSPAKPAAKDAKEAKVETKKKEDTKGKVDLKKEKNSFGLGLVGGSDTPLGEILIHEIFPDSPAAKNNILKPGFRINKINDTDLKNLSHESAMEVLRNAQDKVTLYYEKREGGDDVDLFQKIDITLNRKATKGLGISLVGRRDGPGVFVSALVPGSLAESSGLLIQGDQIIKVNEIDLEKANQDTAVAVMKSTTGDIKITVKRLNAISKS